MSGETTNHLPRRLGRYDVLYPFATSRHSSLLVARLDQPGRAPEPVMIRRIDPNLIRGRDVETFLSNARRGIGSAHPNVVHVKEVGAADDEVFLVMDHLEGESAATVLKRLATENRTLDVGLTAYIVAEAAAALDAVHDGGNVYEHLTPHEIFIGYDGRVKVFDVGQASALATLATSKAKSVDPAELPYSSPERCKGDLAQQRSDVFSLGAILWHLMSGISPYEQSSEMDTVRAILSAEPMIPEERLREIPTQLLEIARRAVSRERARRYATARALRHEIRTFLRSLPNGASLTESLSRVMHELFADAIRQQRAALSRVDSHSDAPPSTISTIPPARADMTDEETVERLTVEVTPPVGLPKQNELIAETVSNELDPTDLIEAESTVNPPITPPRRGRMPVAIGALLVLAVIVFVLFGRSPKEAPARKADLPPTVKDAPTAPATPTPTALPTPTAVPTAPPEEKLAEATASETTITIDTIPTRSSVTVAGRAAGVTPLDLKLPKGEKAVVVEIRYPGYQPLRAEVTPDVDQRLKLSLNPIAPRPVASTTSTSATPYHRFE